MNEKFEDSLKSMSLEGILVVIGILSQRALELMLEDKKPKSTIVKAVEIPSV